MRKLALIALTAAAAAILPGAASAQTVVHSGPGTMTTGGTFVHGGMFPHQLHRGFFIPPMWFGPQFHVSNWQVYGFPAPPADHRWVRYYNDAYLVDRNGRIVDTRQGLDWDRYGERWNMAGGIPHYYGSNEWRPGPEDYAWVERYRGYGYAQQGAGPPPVAAAAPVDCAPGADCRTVMVPPTSCGGYAYGCGGYGYGYGVIAYPIVIETTVVGGCGCCCTTEEVVEEVVEYRARPRPRPRPPVRRRPPPPPPGERG
jgi:Nickel/cobalt transporter regulator